MVEIAVAFPILLLVTMAVADYARVYYTGITVANAAAAGAHYGVANLKGIKADSMIMAAQLDADSTLDSVTAGQFCRCPATGVVACAGTDCGAYGLPQVYDSVRVRKDVTLYIRYLGLPSTVTVTQTAILREK
jgi:Flp pilus assembly protein TadG